MSKVRKIPVVVEAFHFKDVSCVDGLIAFVGEDHIEGYTDTEEPEKPIPLYHIKTLEGDMRVSEGDWIIKGVKGEFYPCKPDVFKQTYEVVDENGDDKAVEGDALEKLASELGMFEDFNRDANRVNGYVITKSKRIVSEIAKVKCDGKGVPNWGESSRAIAKCREIAKEGK